MVKLVSFMRKYVMKAKSFFLRFNLLPFLLLFVFIPTVFASRGVQVVSIKDKAGNQVGLYKESHALIIGVSNYTNGWPVLPGVLKDVELVKQALKQQGFNVVVVKDPNRRELEDAFQNFITRYGKEQDNRLLIYFAGHGHTLKLEYGEEMGYIVPVEAPNPNRDKDGFLEKALDMQQMEVYAKRIRSKHALFLFDSCFSGSIFALSRAIPENISYKTSKPVRQFITAGRANETVPDESIFRSQFIAALQGEGDYDKDGYLTGVELGEFLQKTVVNYSRGSQHPQYGKIRNPHLDKGDFVFSLSPQEKQKTVLPKSKLDPETEMWKLVKNTTNVEDIRDFLNSFPNGRLSSVARLKIKQLKRLERKTPASRPKSASERERIRNASANPTILLESSKGDIRIELYEKEAPVTVKNFLAYISAGHYNNLIFHRVIPNFMIQGGGFDTKMNQKIAKPPIKNEADNGIKNERGTISMARSSVTGSATSQFFINLVDNNFLDHRNTSPSGFGYAVFGKVVTGMDVVDTIGGVKTGAVSRFSDVPLKHVIIKNIKVLP